MRNSTATLLAEVCSNVYVEPHLQPLEQEKAVRTKSEFMKWNLLPLQSLYLIFKVMKRAKQQQFCVRNLQKPPFDWKLTYCLNL